MSDVIDKIVIRIMHYPGSGLPPEVIAGYEEDDKPCWYVEDDQDIFVSDCFETRDDAIQVAKSYKVSLMKLRYKQDWGFDPKLSVIIEDDFGSLIPTNR